MASKQINDSKREEMKSLMDGASKNFTRKELALALNVSNSAISSYASGKSMGTNIQRQILVALGKSLDAAVVELAECAASWRKCATEHDADIAEGKFPHASEEFKARGERFREHANKLDALRNSKLPS